eukprot:2714939-Amphidinium_carterae.1
MHEQLQGNWVRAGMNNEILVFHTDRENNSDHQYHSNRKKNNKFQEHRYTPRYWKNEQTGSREHLLLQQNSRTDEQPPLVVHKTCSADPERSNLGDLDVLGFPESALPTRGGARRSSLG